MASNKFIPDYRSDHLDVEGWLGSYDVTLTEVDRFEWSMACPWCGGVSHIKQIHDKWPDFSCADDECSEYNIEHLIEHYPVDNDRFCRIKIMDRPGLQVAGAPSFKSRYFIRPLGVTTDGMYFYQCGPQGHIVSLHHGKHNKSGFFHLIPDRSFWYGECQMPNDPAKLDWDKAALKYMGLCKEAGYFSMTHIRRSGVWRDDERIVANLGDCLWVDGEFKALYDIEGEYFYDRGPRVPTPGLLPPATNEDLAKLVPIAKQFPFVNDYSHIVCAGLVIVGLIPNLVDWRPHVWLSGQPGSGKSKTAQLLFAGMWVPNGGFAQQSDTTSAGIIEKMDCQCVSVVIDDQRIDSNATSVMRLEDLIAMLRGASSAFEGTVAKGGTRGGKHSVMKSCFVINSVNYPVSDKQDRERIFNIRCDREKQSDDWNKFKREVSDTINPAYAASVFHRVLKDSAKILAVIDGFIKHLGVVSEEFGLTARYRDQWGTVMGAAWWTLNPDKEITQAEAIAFFKKYFVREAYEMDVMSEGGPSIAHQALQTIMGFTPQGERRTVGDAVWHIWEHQNGSERDIRAIPPNERESCGETFLARCGIRIQKGCLIVGAGHEKMRTILGKIGVVNYVGALSAYPGASRVNKTMVFAGSVSACRVEIPLALVYGEKSKDEVNRPSSEEWDSTPPQERVGLPEDEGPLF